MRGRRGRLPGILARWFAVAAASALTTSITLMAATPASAEQGPYVALGDSYSSGLGTRDYDPDSGDCQRGPAAYPHRVADSLGVELTFEACSSAEVGDILSNQLGSLNEATGYVTVTVGGNDAGFTSVVSRCAMPAPTTCWDEIEQANAFITNELPGQLDELYAAIADAAPNANVAAVGYPRLFNGEECNLISRISSEEQAELNATADLLADAVGEAAARNGFSFVDPRDAFTGHAVCDDDEWINGISNPLDESYHPNVAGHRDGYAPVVSDALGALSAA